MKNPIKVLIVEDSPVALAILLRMLKTTQDIVVVGTASNGLEGLDLIPKLSPEVICTDFHMPKMNGLEFIKEVMKRFPRPILVISVSVHDDDHNNIFQLIGAGALDVFPKPKGGLGINFDALSLELIQKIKILSGIVTFSKHKTEQKPDHRHHRIPEKPAYVQPVEGKADTSVVVIGASTGGPQAYEAILPKLPADFPVPIFCVQHISEGFISGLVDWLNSHCKIKIALAKLGELPEAGTAYFAPDGAHLKIGRSGRFTFSHEATFMGHRPSVNMTMSSAAEFYKAGAIGILLTGMGIDGADGLLSIYNQGGLTIAQDETSSIVFGMPKKAIEIGAARYVIALENISDMLIKCVDRQRIRL
jgi:two-component system chemotaxis response regulator CheB